MSEDEFTEINEIFMVLSEINKEKGGKVDDELLKQIISIVIKNPLDEDRAIAQRQIDSILRQHIKEKGGIE